MAIIFEEKERNVIPRWRNSLIAVKSKEFSTLTKNTLILNNDKFLTDKKNNWETEQDEASAIELVYSSYILHEFVLAKSAAEFLLSVPSKISPTILEIANHIVHGEKKQILFTNPSTIFDQTIKYHRIRLLKNKINDDPRNAIARIDIAREYTINGQFDKAFQNIKIALDLNKFNRFIIRSAVRFLIHTGNPDYADNILKKSDNIKNDPWLLAAELASSSILKKPSKFYKDGVLLLEHNSYPDYHITELAASLGTHEFYFGSIKKAKKFFRRATISPNENVIAQIIWTYNQLGIKDFNIEGLDLFRLNEALARDNFIKGNWNESLAETIKWFNDQPFSRGHAHFGSYVASGMLEDYDTAIKLCEISLESNSNDFTLLNNIAFSFASKNDTTNAERYFAKINILELELTQKVVYLATKGLIEFRKKKYQDGEYYYRQAIEIATKNKFDIYIFSASLYLFREQTLAGIDTDISIDSFLEKFTKYKQNPNYLAMLKRVENIKNKILSR